MALVIYQPKSLMLHENLQICALGVKITGKGRVYNDRDNINNLIDINILRNDYEREIIKWVR